MLGFLKLLGKSSCSNVVGQVKALECCWASQSAGMLLEKSKCWKVVGQVEIVGKLLGSKLQKKSLSQSCRRNCWVNIVEETVGSKLQKNLFGSKLLKKLLGSKLLERKLIKEKG